MEYLFFNYLPRDLPILNIVVIVHEVYSYD